MVFQWYSDWCPMEFKLACGFPVVSVLVPFYLPVVPHGFRWVFLRCYHVCLWLPMVLVLVAYGFHDVCICFSLWVVLSWSYVCPSLPYGVRSVCLWFAYVVRWLSYGCLIGVLCVSCFCPVVSCGWPIVRMMFFFLWLPMVTFGCLWCPIGFPMLALCLHVGVAIVVLSVSYGWPVVACGCL